MFSRSAHSRTIAGIVYKLGYQVSRGKSKKDSLGVGIRQLKLY